MWTSEYSTPLVLTSCIEQTDVRSTAAPIAQAEGVVRGSTFPDDARVPGVRESSRRTCWRDATDVLFCEIFRRRLAHLGVGEFTSAAGMVE